MKAVGPSHQYLSKPCEPGELEKTIKRAQTLMELLSANHAEVGAYLLGLGGLPDPIVSAVAFHETPSQCPLGEFGPLGVVHAASRVVLNPDVADPESATPSLDLAYLTQLGLINRWGEWQAVWRHAREEGS